MQKQKPPNRASHDEAGLRGLRTRDIAGVGRWIGRPGMDGLRETLWISRLAGGES